MEKLASRAPDARASRAIRRQCTRLIEADAQTFSRVIRLMVAGDHAGAKRALKAAIQVPWQVFAASQRLQRLARRISRGIKPRYRVDLHCAVAIARAAGTSAKALIATNLAWLNEPAYSRAVRRKMAQGA